jgi:dihydroorotase
MQISLLRPDDWHIHLRDDAMLKAVVPDVAREFARAIVMPNLAPPVLTTDDARAYRKRILAAVPGGVHFDPLMTLYLTGQTSPSEIACAKASGIVQAVKLYPAGATTNSDRGVTDMRAVYPVFEVMQKKGMALCVHGEVVDANIDIFDREKVFIDRVLEPLLRDFPELNVVMEHITTRDAAEFVSAAPANIGATITAHHLLYNRNALLVGGIRPHFYCLPILKRESHRQALVAAAISGNPKFFLGTDSAPHPKGAKESSCGCAGCYTAHAAIELYAEAFEQAGALDMLEGFASHFGADFYGLPRNIDRITLVKEDWIAPALIEVDVGVDVVPLRAGDVVRWRLL